MPTLATTYSRRPINAAQRLTVRQSFIPKDAHCVLEHENGSAAYVYTETRNGWSDVLYACAFWGTSAKPLFHNRFKSTEQRDKAIIDFKERVEYAVTRKAAHRATKAAWTNPLKVGAVLVSSWGYDQTNVDFYVVTRVSGKRVWVRSIAQDSEATGYMSGNCWPKMPIEPVGDETMHIAQPSGENGTYVKISSCQHAYPETGRSHGYTSYA